MMMFAAFWGFLRGPALRFLGGLPRPVWYGLVLFAAGLLAWHWHNGRVASAYADGGRAQAGADRQRLDAATASAARRQAELIAALGARQADISKGSNDALLARDADLARRYADLRLRWAAYQADSGRAGQAGAAAVPGTAAGVDDAACAARGWVDFTTAAAAAQAADGAIAKDDAWIAWAKAQAAAWPRD